MNTLQSLPPEVGQAVRVRNRLGTVRSVDIYDSREAHGRLHLVEVEYLDDWRYPEADQVLWETEVTAEVLGKTSLPAVDQQRPDHPQALSAFISANRWTRLNRLREGDSIESEPLLGVWNSAIQVHPYQLEPVIRALQMPRVSLLLADGVGLGKTIQAGLVLEELLLRRRIRRILVVCPAMLQRQWLRELKRKFNLDFQIVDSDSTFQMRRQLGIDTNPWKAYPRIITSMDYLRLPDVLQQFCLASGAGSDGNPGDYQNKPHASWDLLIVDECHNFAPQSGSRSSQRTRMLREIRFLFEHRVFLSATPHNGKTVCFTGLLELLDPVRFQMSVDMDQQSHNSLGEVRIRRLKEDVNKHYLQAPFADMLPPVELPLELSKQEAGLYRALRIYRNKAQDLFDETASPTQRWVTRFVFSILTKRLLSCPYAFARTWWRHIGEDLDEEEETLFDLARISSEKAEEELKSDDEKSRAEEDAARHGGAWLRSEKADLRDLQQMVIEQLERLGYDRDIAEDESRLSRLTEKSDSKTEALVQWVRDNLFRNGKLRDDERLIVFTEYKETLNYLRERFILEGFDENTMRTLYGGMDARAFESVQQDFEDQTSPVRLLLATDAASEGINMQECCRWVIHYDIPWSPTKIQQRNGRVSRHGQIHDVSVHYFRCDQEEDMDFLRKVAGKVHKVEKDLGSVERVFDATLQRHFEGETIEESEIDRLIEFDKTSSNESEELGQASGEEIEELTRQAQHLLEMTNLHLRISPQALVDLLRTAIAVEGSGSLDEIESRPGFYRLTPPSAWQALAQETRRAFPDRARKGPAFLGQPAGMHAPLRQIHRPGNGTQAGKRGDTCNRFLVRRQGSTSFGVWV